LQYGATRLSAVQIEPEEIPVSRQLAVASSFAVFALAALALFAPGSARLGHDTQTGATTELAAPAFSASLSLAD
jgi:hypothetical protein